jgi:hypothetical protein
MVRQPGVDEIVMLIEIKLIVVVVESIVYCLLLDSVQYHILSQCLDSCQLSVTLPRPTNKGTDS